MKVLVVLCFLIASAAANSFGAPISACTTLTPQHGFNLLPQTSPLPVRIILSKTKILPGESIYITIESINPAFEFRGFLVQPRSVVAPHSPVGIMEWVNPDCYSRLDCNGLTSATHVRRHARNTETFVWTAPKESGGIRVQ